MLARSSGGLYGGNSVDDIGGVVMTETRPVIVPPVLYLPCQPGATADHAEVEMRLLQDGRTALLAYTALDRLADGCGPHQSWVLYKTEELGVLRQTSPYDIVILDQPLPEEVRPAGPVDD